MRLCLVSDLHVDVGGSQPPLIIPECDVLLINGDTANSLGEVDKMLRKMNRRHKIPTILLNDGNHEHYSNSRQDRTIDQTLARLNDLLPANATLMPMYKFALACAVPHVYFVGRCGWYCFRLDGRELPDLINVWREKMNDDYWIGFTKQEDCAPWTLAVDHAEQMRLMMRDMVQRDKDAKFVVATHTVPHRDLLAQGPRWLDTNPFYVNTHMELVAEEFADRIVLWHYGHTHFRGEREINGVRYLANPRGYPGENPRWEPVTVEI